MSPHKLPPVLGKVYQFTTSAGVVRFRVASSVKSGIWECGPWGCDIFSGAENLGRYNWVQVSIKEDAPAWVEIELDDSNDGCPEYPYFPEE